MTLDEAIDHAEDVAKEQDKLSKRYDDASGYSRSHNDDIRTSDAKKCERCAEDHRQLAEWLKDYKRLKEQEPCKDAISRQAVHDAIVRWAGSMSVLIALPTRETIPLLDSIHKLPSVNPQEIRNGHWITEDMFDGCVAYRCSECDELFWLESGTPKDNEYNYCPKCGMRLIEPQESEG